MSLQNKAFAQAAESHDIVAEQAGTRASSGPAGGLLIAVGTSLLLWAAIAQVAKLASSLLF